MTASPQPGHAECNCPDINDMLIRGGVMGTKPPCPVHDTPERMAMLASVIVKAKPRDGFTFTENVIEERP